MKRFTLVKFEGGYTRGDTKISLQRASVIRLSSGFCRITNSKQFKYAILFYDKTNNAIGFKFSNIHEQGSMKITTDRSGAVISAKSFMKANNLSPNEHFGRYDWEKINDPKYGEVFIFILGKK